RHRAVPPADPGRADRDARPLPGVAGPQPVHGLSRRIVALSRQAGRDRCRASGDDDLLQFADLFGTAKIVRRNLRLPLPQPQALVAARTAAALWLCGAARPGPGRADPGLD